jgi:hypothetical protein
MRNHSGQRVNNHDALNVFDGLLCLFHNRCLISLTIHER